MKPVYLLLVALVLLLAADTPPPRHGVPRAVQAPCRGDESRDLQRTADRMGAVVSELQAAQRLDDSGARQSAGGLWMEVNRLRRDGHSARQIEWYVSDLEGSLRRGQSDAPTRRHILNNLDYEIQALRRRHP